MKLEAKERGEEEERRENWGAEVGELTRANLEEELMASRAEVSRFVNVEMPELDRLREENRAVKMQRDTERTLRLDASMPQVDPNHENLQSS